MKGRPTSDVIEHIRDIPIYQGSLAKGHFPLLDKPEIARGFPDNWMTTRPAAALENGEADFVPSTGTPTSCGGTTPTSARRGSRAAAGSPSPRCSRRNTRRGSTPPDAA